MTDLMIGVDVSGIINHGNYVFAGVVAGTTNMINSIMRSTGYDHIHMNRIRNTSIRNHIISTINFDHPECIACCLQIDRTVVFNTVTHKLNRQHKNISTHKIYRAYNYILMRYIRKEIEDFVINHKHSMHDIAFQCDGDFRRIVKDGGFRYDNVGIAYELADVVAWSNNKNQEPRGVNSVPLVNSILGDIQRHFKL